MMTIQDVFVADYSTYRIIVKAKFNFLINDCAILLSLTNRSLIQRRTNV